MFGRKTKARAAGPVLALALLAWAPPGLSQDLAVPAPGPSGFFSFADMVERVSPAVVSVRVRVEVTLQGPSGSPPRTQVRQYQGSGFVISPDGYVVTNHHVIAGALDVTLHFEDGSSVVADVIGSDPRTDIALLKIAAARPLPYLTLADTEARVGDWVVAIGNPFGLGGSVTAGIVSARGRAISGDPFDDFLQIDASINSGNSGGPTFNTDGLVVGVNTAIYSPSGGSVGVGFAVPAYIAAAVVADLMEDGTIDRGFVGVAHHPVTFEVAAAVGLDRPRGSIVSSVTPGMPGEAAGVLPGDVIVAVDGRAVADGGQFARLIAFAAPGSRLVLTVWRDRAEVAVAVELARMDEATAGPALPSVPLGAELEEARPGLRVTAVAAGTPADRAGLGAGDVIMEATQAGWQALATEADLMRAVDRARGDGLPTLLLRVIGDGGPRIAVLPLD